MQGVEAVMQPMRLKGLPDQSLLCKVASKQAPPPNVDLVKILEAALHSSADHFGSVIAGGLCHFSDGQVCQTYFDEDSGFLETLSRRIKTGTSVADRLRLLPMVAPACGV